MAPGWKARQTKREKASRPDPLEDAVFVLLAAGWQVAGKTSEEMVRFPTKDTPVGNHGASGGKLVTFGGRRRFVLPKTPRVCTVGKRTVCFYVLDDNRKPVNFTALSTKDLDAVRTTAAAGKPDNLDRHG